MSPVHDRDVAKLVKKYKSKYPTAPRALLRETLRLKLEKQKIFTEAVKKKLDRELRKIFEKETASLITSKRKLYSPPPKLMFFVTQDIQGSLKRQLPSVGFNLVNPNNYSLKVRLEVRVILGGKNLGLIQDRKGYYNGKAVIGLEPGEGFWHGNFSVPEECVHSDEELTLEVRSRAINPDNKEYIFLSKSWTYMRKKNSWFYEPRAFTEGK
jgi:hypothetical protein